MYTVILAPEESGIAVFCPAFGIASCGDNREHALRMIVEAMTVWISVEREKGRSIPGDTVEALAMTIGDVLRDREEENLPLLIETAQVQVDARMLAA